MGHSEILDRSESKRGPAAFDFCLQEFLCEALKDCWSSAASINHLRCVGASSYRLGLKSHPLNVSCPLSVCNADYPCEGMSRHATFENFGMAFLTLFQVSTGDNWNGIMKVFPVYSQTSPCLPFHFISSSRATTDPKQGSGECLSA